MVVLLVTLLAILVLFSVWSRGREPAHSVPSYFFNAVKVYALLGEEDAKVAARAPPRAGPSEWRVAPEPSSFALEIMYCFLSFSHQSPDGRPSANARPFLPSPCVSVALPR